MSSLDFESYDDLQTVIATYLQRANLTNQIPLFIQLAEVRLRDLIRTHPSQVQLPYTITPAAQQQVVALPSDYGAMIRSTYGNKPLSLISPDQIELWKNSSQTHEYTIVGNNLILQTFVDGVKSLTIYYYQMLQGLSDSNESNWLLEDYPNLYLYASLLEAEPYMFDDERVTVWAEMLQQSIQQMQDAARKQNLPHNSKLTIKKS